MSRFPWVGGAGAGLALRACHRRKEKIVEFLACHLGPRSPSLGRMKEIMCIIRSLPALGRDGIGCHARSFFRGKCHLSLGVPSFGKPSVSDRRALRRPFRALQSVFCASQRIFHAPQNVFCTPQKILCAPQNVFCTPQKFLCAPQKVFCAPQKVFCAPQKVLCTPQNVLCKQRPCFPAQLPPP